MVHYTVYKIYLWRRQWHPTPVLLPGTSHGRRSLVGCSPWGREESDTTERLDFHFSLSCTGEGNGNPLQCSCLENPGDGGAWWAAVCGVAQSRTRLKWLSSSSRVLLLIPEFFSLTWEWKLTNCTGKTCCLEYVVKLDGGVSAMCFFPISTAHPEFLSVSHLDYCNSILKWYLFVLTAL